MANNIPSITGVKSSLEKIYNNFPDITAGLATVQLKIAQFCGEGGGLYKLYTETWFPSNVRSAFQDVASKLLDVTAGIRGANTKIQDIQAKISDMYWYFDQFDTWAFTQAVAGAAANQWAQEALSRLKNIRDGVGEDFAKIAQTAESWGAWGRDRANEFTVGKVNEAANVLRGEAANAYATLRSEADAKLTQAKQYVDQKVAGILDLAKQDASSKANAALAAANQNLNTRASDIDKQLADIIGKLGKVDQRETDLENKLPLATDALNRRIDEANQSATDKANAALAAANLNIQGVRDKVTSELDNHDDRIRKIEMEIEKVAPVLARLPSL